MAKIAVITISKRNQKRSTKKSEKVSMTIVGFQVSMKLEAY